MTSKPSRTAANDAGDFARWAASNLEPMEAAEIEAFITRRLGMEIKPPRRPRPGFRFQPGDTVQIAAAKHRQPETAEIYAQYNGKVGEVVGVSSTGAVVRFNSGVEVEFPDAQKTRGVGIYRYTPPFVLEGSAAIEMVYLAEEGDVHPDRKVIVEKYLSGGRSGPRRSGNYYSGHVFNALYNAAGQVYFSVFPQQRVEVDPQSEAGYLPRSFNPIKGKVVYLGLLGRRPAGWESQFAAQQLAVAGEMPEARLSSDLRARLIRLAHTNPELRPHLLPLLK